MIDHKSKLISEKDDDDGEKSDDIFHCSARSAHWPVVACQFALSFLRNLSV